MYVSSKIRLCKTRLQAFLQLVRAEGAFKIDATCFGTFGPHTKQGMRRLLADEVRPCSIYGEAVGAS
jgi:hypothetical protein